ncbi:MAG: hypothetical protein NTY19_46310 [Planctomycetota bacterium]|nr:hypothetical protein [Planctomycetota bacterium]
MSVATSTDRLTAEDFFRWVSLPENRDLHAELEQGEVIELPPPGKYYGFVCGR